MTYQATRLTLNINPGPQADAEEIAELTRQLRTEVMELNVESIDLVHAREVPAQAKSGDPITWGTLLVTLAASGGVLTTLINVLQPWLTRHKGCSVTLEIDGDKLEVQGISSKEQRRLINDWLSRHPDFLIAK